MREVRAVTLSLLALCGALAVAAPASVAGPTGATAASTANNTSMGSQVSTFMQSTSGQTGEEVESGMWTAAYENASNRSAVVQRRAASIDSRLAELQAEKRRLIEAKRNGSISQTEYRARMSQVVGRLAALNRSIEETERQAVAAGVNTSVVEGLRERARNLSGQEVAAVARSMAGGPPAGVPAGRNGTGPPDDAGPPNGTSGPPDDGGPPNGTSGPPDDAGPPNGTNGSANATTGPPDDGGAPNGSDGGNGQGPPDDGGGSGDGGSDQGQGNNSLLSLDGPATPLRSR